MPESPHERVIGTLMSKFASKAVSVAAELDLADEMANGPVWLDELAASTGTDGDALGRLLRALVTFGIFEETSAGSFGNTPASDLLRSDVDGSLRAMAVWMGHDIHAQMLGELETCLRTGDNAAASLFPGQGIFEVLTGSEELRSVFGEAMTAKTSMTGRALLDGYDFSPHRRIVDVGGGRGGLAVMIAEAHPDAEITLFDMPGVVDDAQEIVSASPSAGRIRLVAGDFFEEVPGPADAYVLKSVIHDWPDDKAVTILGNCRSAMASDGRVIVCEALIGGPAETVGARLLDLEMLVGPGGRERSEEQYRRLFGSANLELVAVHPTPGPVVALEARAA